MAKPKNTDEPKDIASDKQNDRLKHSEGGVTTRDDANDVGVPMLPGSPDEPVGPEDALGEGPKRGDYRNRLGGTVSHEMVRVPDAKAGEPTTKVVEQNVRAEDIGDEKGKKGGVETAPTATS